MAQYLGTVYPSASIYQTGKGSCLVVGTTNPAERDQPGPSGLVTQSSVWPPVYIESQQVPHQRLDALVSNVMPHRPQAMLQRGTEVKVMLKRTRSGGERRSRLTRKTFSEVYRVCSCGRRGLTRRGTDTARRRTEWSANVCMAFRDKAHVGPLRAESIAAMADDHRCVHGQLRA
jgi:hypothetical protein